MCEWFTDVLVFSENYLGGKKIYGSFNAIDSYSGLLISYLIPDQTSKTIINTYRKMFSTLGCPKVIVSDNAPNLNLSPAVAKFLTSMGVEKIVTSSSYNSQGNGKIERVQSSIRRLMRITSETYQRSPIEIYYSIIMAINQRPLTISHNPHIKHKLLNSERVISPMELHYGRPNVSDPLARLQIEDDDEVARKFREKWENIISELNQKLDQELEKRNELRKRPDFQPGDLVYLIRHNRTKADLKYIKNIFEITKLSHDKCFVKPLFKSSQGETHANLQDVKRYDYSHLQDILPAELRTLLGEVPSPEQIKEMAEQGQMPHDLEPNNIIRPLEPIKLRDRLAPRDEGSLPAIEASLSDVSYESSDTESELDFDHLNLETFTDNSATEDEEEPENVHLGFTSNDLPLSPQNSVNDIDLSFNLSNHKSPVGKSPKAPRSITFGILPSYRLEKQLKYGRAKSLPGKNSVQTFKLPKIPQRAEKDSSVGFNFKKLYHDIFNLEIGPNLRQKQTKPAFSSRKAKSLQRNSQIENRDIQQIKPLSRSLIQKIDNVIKRVKPTFTLPDLNILTRPKRVVKAPKRMDL